MGKNKTTNKMEKYNTMLINLVPNVSDRNSMLQKLSEIKERPQIYLENNNRFATSSDDYMWLAMVDLLISSGYAFEIDWKEDFETAKEYTEKLLKKNNVFFQFNLDDEEDLEAEEFFKLMNEELKENTEFQLCNLDIDSDSYVSSLINKNNFDTFRQIDNRIKTY